VGHERRSSDYDGPAVEVDVAQDYVLSDDAAVLVHRVAGELLRNAFRHARAGSVRVVLVCTAEDSVELTVADDGVGFEPSRSRRPGHVGLQLVQQVVGDSGGRMFLGARPGVGTTVRVHIPQRPMAWRVEPAVGAVA
jgi:two-component system NarL family sensor kinase